MRQYKRHILSIFILAVSLLTLYLYCYGLFNHSIPNFHRVYPWLYRGGDPIRGGIAKLQDIGIKTIINLEYDFFKLNPNKDEIKEERKQATKANMRFEHIPMHPIWPPKEEQIDKALALIQDQDNWPIYIHCEHGVNRTGLVIGAYRVKVEGWTPQQAYNEMVRLGFRRYLFWWKRAFFRYANKK